MYYEKARNELLGIECVKQHEPQTITGLSCLIYGLPNQALVQQAQRILSEPTITGDNRQIDEVSAEAAAAALQSVLERVGLDRWRAVVYEPMLAKMAVHRLDKEVRILAGATFSLEGVRRLIIHEIGVHVLRYENGLRQPIKLFANGFTDYLETEEGLAVFCEAEAGLLEKTTVCKYAGRVSQPISLLIILSARCLVCLHHNLTRQRRLTLWFVPNAALGTRRNLGHILRTLCT